MSVSSIPSTFLAGFRDRLTSDTLQLLWNNRPDAEKQQLTRQASIPAPPASFLPNPNITSLAREAAWLGLTDAQRAPYLDGTAGATGSGLISNAAGASTYRQAGFGSQASATPPAAAPLDLAGRLDALSATPATADSAAFRAIWKENFATSSLLDANGSAGDTNGGAVFVTIRGGKGAERVTNPYVDDTTQTTDAYDRFEKQVTDQVKGITDRFGAGIAVLGYDANGNGYLDSEAELFGFDGAVAGPSLAAQGLLSDRLMVLTAAGQSVKVNQSSFATTANAATGGYLPYTTARTVLQRSTTDGTLEIVVATSTGIDTPPPAPKVAWIGLPIGTVNTGQPLDVAVTFDRDVTVQPAAPDPGTTIDIDVGGQTRQASLFSAAGSTLVFRYVVDAADVDADGVSVPAGVIAVGPGTTLRDAKGEDVVPDLPATTNDRTLVNDQPPAVVGVAGTAGVYKKDDTILVTVSFDRAVTVDGPTSGLALALDVGGVSRTAVYDSGTADTLTFRYTVAATDLDGDAAGVQAQANGLTLSGGTRIRDAFDNDAVLSFGLTDTGMTVDGVLPQVSTVTVPSNTFGIGDAIDVVVTFDEAVSVAGGATLALDLDGGTTVQAALLAPTSGSTQATFRHVVQPGDTAVSGITVPADALVLDATGTVTDAAGNVVTATSLASPAQGAPGVVIDGTRPSATVFTAQPGSGDTFASTVPDTVSVTLAFDEPVDLAGSDVTLQILVAGNPRTAQVTTTPGTGLTALTFAYEAGSGGVDVGTGFDVVADSLSVGSGSTLTDANGNAANTTNPSLTVAGVTFV